MNTNMRLIVLILLLVVPNFLVAQELTPNYKKAWDDYTRALTCYYFLPDRTWINLARAQQKVLMYEAEHDMKITGEDLDLLWQHTIDMLDPGLPEKEPSEADLSEINNVCIQAATEIAIQWAGPKYDEVLLPLQGYTVENLIMERMLHDKVVTCYATFPNDEWWKGAALGQLEYVLAFAKKVDAFTPSQLEHFTKKEKKSARDIFEKETKEAPVSFDEWKEAKYRCGRVKKEYNSAPDRLF